MTHLPDIKDKVIAITGASSGIGEAAARALAKQGAKLALAARRDNRLANIAKEFSDRNPDILIHKTDVTQPDQIHDFFQKILERFSTLDVLVNNAGVGCVGRMATVNLENVRQVMEVNYFGAIHCIQEAVAIMKKNQSGHIINISSIIGKRAVPEIGSYCATKFALNAATDALRLELKGSGIKVTTLCPGITQSEFSQHQIRPKSIKPYRAKLKGQTSEKVAKAILKAIHSQPREVHLTLSGKILVQMERISPWSVDHILGLRNLFTE